MSTFILVHGSGQHAGCWTRLGAELESDGHRVVTPQLPKEAPEWGLERYARAVADLMDDPQSIVVAHSLSGAILPLVPALHPCTLLVFLAAVIPAPGRSVRDQFTQDPAMFSPEWIAAGTRWFDPSQARALGEEFLFHDCDAQTLEWALGTIDPLVPGNLVTQPCPLEDWPAVRSAAIVAARDRTLAPDWCRRRSREQLHAEPLDIDTGHTPHASRPRELATTLERLAASTRI